MNIKYILLLIIIIVLTVLSFIFLAHKPKNEYLDVFYIDRPYPSTHSNFPFWNTQLGTTRNMSYDLRGDIPIPYTDMVFNNSSLRPIHNRCLGC